MKDPGLKSGRIGRRWKGLTALMLIGVLVVVAGCARPAYPTPAKPQPTTPAAVATPTPIEPTTPRVATPTPTSAVPEVRITGTYPAFNPSTVQAPKGKSKFVFRSTDRPHTFTVPELNINIAVGAGQQGNMEVNLEKEGTFTFYCAVPGHRGAGMEGKLQVGGGGTTSPPTPPGPSSPTPEPTPYSY